MRMRMSVSTKMRMQMRMRISKYDILADADADADVFYVKRSHQEETHPPPEKKKPFSVSDHADRRSFRLLISDERCFRTHENYFLLRKIWLVFQVPKHDIVNNKA